MTPAPPSRAMAIASFSSVTVSIAAEMMGTLSATSAQSIVFTSHSFGNISEYPGISRTSSYEKASLNIFPSRNQWKDNWPRMIAGYSPSSPLRRGHIRFVPKNI